MMVVENGRLVEKEVPMRNVMNELLREEYIKDCQRVVKAWNRALTEEGVSFRVSLPHHRFFRRQGIYKDHHFAIDGSLIDENTWVKNQSTWLPTDEEREYVKSLMKPVYEAGQCAHWIAPPKRGINKQSFAFEYIRH